MITENHRKLIRNKQKNFIPIVNEWQVIISQTYKHNIINFLPSGLRDLHNVKYAWRNDTSIGIITVQKCNVPAQISHLLIINISFTFG